MPFSTFEFGLEIIALIGVISGLAVLYSSYAQLPDMVPIHYGVTGIPNSYAEKWTVAILPIIGTAVYILLSFLRRAPHQFNYPKPVTAENAARLYKSGIMLIAFLKTTVVWLFTYLEWMTVKIAMREASGLPTSFLPVFVVFMLAIVVYYSAKIYLVK